MRTLLVLDIDKTLCDSRELDKWLPAKSSGDMTDWWNAINKSDLPVVSGATTGVQNLLDTLQPVKVLLLTSRTNVIFDATANWVERNFPTLPVRQGRFASLSMREPTDHSSVLASKKKRLAKYKRLYEVDRVVVVDDEAVMNGLLIGKHDRFIQIKNCKWNKKDYTELHARVVELADTRVLGTRAE